MKKRISILVAVLLTLVLLPALLHSSEADGSGNCGANLGWSFNSADQTLTISGTGEMSDYSYHTAPWNSELANIKKVVVSEGVTRIGNAAFWDAINITEVSLPGTLKSIGNNAFRDCESLRSIVLPNSVTQVGPVAFGGCTSMTSASISTGMTTIPTAMFSSCTSLASITIPDSITTIEQDAFWHCASLTSVTIPASVAEIGPSAFAKCLSMERFVVTGANNNFCTIDDVLFTKDRETLIAYPLNKNLTAYTVPDGVVQIEEAAFGFSSKLETIELPDCLRSLGAGALGNNPVLKSVRIPDGVETLSFALFINDTALERIVLPRSVKATGESALYGCTALEDIYYFGTESDKALIDFDDEDDIEGVVWHYGMQCGDDLYALYLDFDTTLEIAGTGDMYDYSYHTAPWDSERENITNVIVGSGVTRIGNSAFREYKKIKTVTLPDTLKSIGDFAFRECKSLESIVLPNSVNEVSWTAFAGCAAMKSATLSTGMTTIPTAMFSSCTSLASITIPDSITTIEQDAFWHCASLTSVTIPANVTTIEPLAFAYCTGVKSFGVAAANTKFCAVDGALLSKDKTRFLQYPLGKAGTTYTVPDTVKTIDDEAFACSKTLTEVKLPDNLEMMGGYAFAQSTALKTAEIPESITVVHPGTFIGCTALETVVLPKTIEVIEEYAFNNCPALTDVYYFGTAAMRSEISFDDDNDDLLNATWHYVKDGRKLKIEWNSEDVQMKGSTAYVIANGKAQTPRFTVLDVTGAPLRTADYTYEYKENKNAGTGYVIVTFKENYYGTSRQFFKIYLPATTTTTVANVSDGIKLSWSKVEGADGYVIYRRAWSSTTNGWTDFVRWNNTTALNWTDTNVYAGTRYQYGIKAYFARRVDPVSGATIGGNVGDNFNLGEVGPLKTTVRITTRTLNSVTAGTKQMTVKWSGSSVFTGYQIQYATNSAFTQNAKAIKITNPKTVQQVIKNLTSGKTYYVRIRSYHEFNGMTYFGGWSNVLSCKVK